MSFLNPVNEPVLRFKSTDAGAPQINYNARVAGDVKAVLKGCLVTGYGDKASAGWSIVNEVDHVAEFVSPNVAMSDYKLGFDDASASNTTWYYQYQNARVNPTANTVKKSLASIDKTHASNGWQLIVSECGFMLVEIVYRSDVAARFGRITYFGQVKSALIDSGGHNMSFWCVGHGAPTPVPYTFFATSLAYYKLQKYSSLKFSAANLVAVTSGTKVYDTTAVDVIAPIYLTSVDGFSAEQPAVLLKDTAKTTDLYGVRDDTLGTRPVLYICLGREVQDTYLTPNVVSVLIPLDHWEY